MRQLLDPRLRIHLEDTHFSSLCTILSVSYTESASHQQVESGTSPVSGMVNIPCTLGPLIELRPTDTEIRTSQIEERRVQRQCKLSGYYPLIEPRIHRASIDGVTYPVVGVEHDSQRFTTRMRLEEVLP